MRGGLTNAAAAQPRLARYRIGGQMLGRFVGSGHTSLQIQMPAHALSRVLHFDSEIAVHGAADQRVVAQSPVAMQADSSEMRHEGISRSGGLHKKRTGFGVPPSHTTK